MSEKSSTMRICNHLCNSIDKSFPTHWNAASALMAIDKTVYSQSVSPIVFCSPTYCSHMLCIIQMKWSVHADVDRPICSNFLLSSPLSHHKCENLIITAAHDHSLSNLDTRAGHQQQKQQQ